MTVQELIDGLNEIEDKENVLVNLPQDSNGIRVVLNEDVLKSNIYTTNHYQLKTVKLA